MLKNVTVIKDVNLDAKVKAVVGMAVYQQDRLDWITEAIESLLMQTYKKTLIVVIIDGSVSTSVFDYLNKTSLDNSNFALLLNKENLGLSYCMNAVIEWCRPHQPEYFFRMDADDICSLDRLEHQIRYLDNHPAISVLGTALDEINEYGKKVGQRSLPLKHGDIVKFLPKRCSINHPTVALRFNVFSNGRRYRETLRNTQDYFFWIDLVSAGFKFANLNEKLLKFRRVNDFYKRRGLDKSLNEFKARFYAMKELKRFTIGNVIYAFSVLLLRLMPSKVVKIAYKIDRYFLNKRVKSK